MCDQRMERFDIDRVCNGSHGAIKESDIALSKNTDLTFDLSKKKFIYLLVCPKADQD